MTFGRRLSQGWPHGEPRSFCTPSYSVPVPDGMVPEFKLCVMAGSAHAGSGQRMHVVVILQGS